MAGPKGRDGRDYDDETFLESDPVLALSWYLVMVKKAIPSRAAWIPLRVASAMNDCHFCGLTRARSLSARFNLPLRFDKTRSLMTGKGESNWGGRDGGLGRLAT